MGYLNYNYGPDDSGAKSDTWYGYKTGGSPSPSGNYLDQQLFQPGGLFGGSKPPPGYRGPGSAYLSSLGLPEPYPGMRAIDRTVDLSGQSFKDITNYFSNAGIFDQTRQMNAAYQQRTEQAIQAGGLAQLEALDEAQGYIDAQAAYGFQQAADLESQILGETRTNLAGSGLWNSSMQGAAAQFALERGMRARLQVDSEVSGLYQRIALGKGSVAAETYNRLAGFYEEARQTNERNLLYEFDWRVGRGNPPTDHQQSDNTSAQWASVAASVIGAIAVAW